MDEDDVNTLKINLYHSNDKDEQDSGIQKIQGLNLEFDKNKNYIYFDPPVLKTLPIKDENKIIKENHQKLKLIDKLICFLKFKNSKRYVINNF